jgi:hypothetical protein
MLGFTTPIWPSGIREDHVKSKCLLTAVVILSAFATGAAFAQQRVNLPITNPEWEEPFPGFKIVGNLYYVGTYDLGCYLIDTGAGLILVNSGAPGSYPLIKANIEALGFKTSDIKIITSTHGHWDHVGDLALFQKDAPGAKTYMSERDAPALESGGNLDYRQAEGRGIIYDPIKVDMRTKCPSGDFLIPSNHFDSMDAFLILDSRGASSVDGQEPGEVQPRSLEISERPDR